MNLNSLPKSPQITVKSRLLIISSVLACLLCTNAFAENLKSVTAPGWHQDDLRLAWSSWGQSCIAFEKKKLNPWISVCDKAKSVDANNEQAIRAFFEQNFTLTPITNEDGSSSGIITGYYEPVLSGSLTADDQYRYPIYSQPESASLRSLSRQEIAENPQAFERNIIAWTDNPYDLFFLHIQGSGLISFANGTQKSLVYAGNNDHDYTSIGKVLIDKGEMQKEKVSMQTLKKWLHEHPDKATDVMHQNQRFIYFKLIETGRNEPGPRGSLNVPLTPLRSIAIDPKQVTMGMPIWLDTTLPDVNQPTVFRRLVFAQDTGAAIKGRIRADVFFGRGQQAEFLAGNMNQAGKMYKLIPK